jgi:hypothetical protein
MDQKFDPKNIDVDELRKRLENIEKLCDDLRKQSIPTREQLTTPMTI